MSDYSHPWLWALTKIRDNGDLSVPCTKRVECKITTESCQNTVIVNPIIDGQIRQNIHLFGDRRFTQVTGAGDLYRPLPEIMQHLMYWSILGKENIYVNTDSVLDNGLWDNCFINVRTGKHFEWTLLMGAISVGQFVLYSCATFFLVMANISAGYSDIYIHMMLLW